MFVYAPTSLTRTVPIRQSVSVLYIIILKSIEIINQQTLNELSSNHLPVSFSEDIQPIEEKRTIRDDKNTHPKAFRTNNINTNL